MDRKTALAVVTATTALMAAGSVAAVATLRATTLTQPVSAVSEPGQIPGSALQIAGPDTVLPAVEAGALPAVTIVQAAAPAAQPAPTGSLPSRAPALASAASAESMSASPLPSAPASSSTATTVTQVQAKAAVLAVVPGSVLGVMTVTRSGYDAWRVAVKRADGSVVAGIVDKASGVIFAWDTVSAPAGTSYNDDDDDDRYEDDDDDDDHYDDDNDDERDDDDD